MGVRDGKRVGVARVELGVGGEHAVWQEVSKLVLRPSVHDAMNDLVQVRTRVDVVGNARGDDREDVPGPLAAFVLPGEEPVLPAQDKSRFILPVSRSERGSTTRGIPRFGTTWTCCTKSRVEAKTSTSASGPTGRG